MSRHFITGTAILLTMALTATAGCHRNADEENAAAPAASVAAPVAPMATAASTPAMGTPATGAMVPGSFVAKAATDGMQEVALAELAISTSSNADVDAFAQTMKDDHSKANIKLASIASADGIEVPTAMTADQQAAIDALKAKNGTDFDQAYADAMVQAHQNAVALFEDASANASTPELRQFASDTLPTLRNHLQMAQTLQSGLSGAGNAGAGDAMGERFGAL